MKFNTRFKVGTAAFVASSAVAIGSFGTGGTATASTCVLHSYNWAGSSAAPFNTTITVPAPVGEEVLQAIYITYDATGEGETIGATIGGQSVGGTGGAGSNVYLLNGTAVGISGGIVAINHETGAAGGLTVTHVLVVTNTCIEDAVTTTTAAPATTVAATTTTAAPATTIAATTTTAAATTTTAKAATTTTAAPTTTAAATTTTVRAATTTTLVASQAGVTTTTTKATAATTAINPASSPAALANIPATGGNVDAIGFLAGMAVLIGFTLLIVRRRTAA